QLFVPFLELFGRKGAKVGVARGFAFSVETVAFLGLPAFLLLVLRPSHTFVLSVRWEGDAGLPGFFFSLKAAYGAVLDLPEIIGIVADELANAAVTDPPDFVYHLIEEVAVVADDDEGALVLG